MTDRTLKENIDALIAKAQDTKAWGTNRRGVADELLRLQIMTARLLREVALDEGLLSKRRP